MGRRPNSGHPFPELADAGYEIHTEGLPDGAARLLGDMEAQARILRQARRRPTTPVVDAIIARVLEDLSESPDYRRVRQEVDAWIAATIRFLWLRWDRAPSEGNYLRRWPEHSGPPHESLLADDYAEFLLTSELGARVTREVPAGGGRVDVHVAFDADTFVTEVKRELQDASDVALEDYALQEALYLGSTSAIGQVLVLDLTDDDRPIDLRDEVWVARVPVRSGRRAGDRFVCIVRVKGRRDTPSAAGARHVATRRRERRREGRPDTGDGT